MLESHKHFKLKSTKNDQLPSTPAVFSAKAAGIHASSSESAAVLALFLGGFSAPSSSESKATFLPSKVPIEPSFAAFFSELIPPFLPFPLPLLSLPLPLPSLPLPLPSLPFPLPS